jgi:hypothetical protein
VPEGFVLPPNELYEARSATAHRGLATRSIIAVMFRKNRIFEVYLRRATNAQTIDALVFVYSRDHVGSRERKRPQTRTETVCRTCPESNRGRALASRSKYPKFMTYHLSTRSTVRSVSTMSQTPRPHTHRPLADTKTWRSLEIPQ